MRSTRPQGYSVLNRIFVENKVSSPYITFYLDRANGTVVSNTGMMTIDEVLPQYSNITSYPKLTVDKVHRLTDADQHWQVLTDTNGIIGPDGNTITLDSIVPSAPDGQLVAVLDTGFTLTQVPRYVSDASTAAFLVPYLTRRVSFGPFLVTPSSTSRSSSAGLKFLSIPWIL
jgi:hypothetical protein